MLGTSQLTSNIPLDPLQITGVVWYLLTLFQLGQIKRNWVLDRLLSIPIWSGPPLNVLGTVLMAGWCRYICLVIYSSGPVLCLCVWLVSASLVNNGLCYCTCICVSIPQRGLFINVSVLFKCIHGANDWFCIRYNLGGVWVSYTCWTCEYGMSFLQIRACEAC